MKTKNILLGGLALGATLYLSRKYWKPAFTKSVNKPESKSGFIDESEELNMTGVDSVRLRSKIISEVEFAKLEASKLKAPIYVNNILSICGSLTNLDSDNKKIIEGIHKTAAQANKLKAPKYVIAVLGICGAITVYANGAKSQDEKDSILAAIKSIKETFASAPKYIISILDICHDIVNYVSDNSKSSKMIVARSNKPVAGNHKVGDKIGKDTLHKDGLWY